MPDAPAWPLSGPGTAPLSRREGSACISHAGGALSSESRQEAEGLYRTYGPIVYRRCLRLLRDREAARDATQEVFVKLLRDERALADAEKAVPWIYRVATNHCLNLRRNQLRRGEQELAPELELASGVAAPDFPGRQLARSVLSRFDAQTQAVAVGVFVDGMEHEEVADALGISRRTVSRKLERFLEQARSFLARSTP
jgi:RNA polymerase sigma-70 factor, ECF subfamily